MSSVERTSELRVVSSEAPPCGPDCGCASAASAQRPASRNGHASNEQAGERYWRSLEEYADTPEFREFMHREFPAGATELLDSGDRRHFLRIMGASMALAGVGLAGCRRWPVQTIVPYASRPEGRMPGVPVQYATTMEVGGVGYGLLATSYDGRPIKIEGNPEHPTTRGRTDAIAQASVLNLYDPDRSRRPRHNGERATMEQFREWVEDRIAPLRNRGGAGLAILSEATSSPSMHAMRRRLAEQYRQAHWYEYEAINNDNEWFGSTMAFGQAYQTRYHFDVARVVVSLDSDFLLSHPAAIAHTNDFAKTRRADNPQREMSRLYVCEGAFSLTGGNADERHEMRSADVAVVAARLASRLLNNADAQLRSALQEFEDVAVETPFIDRMVQDLQRARGASIVIAGRNQPPHVHFLAHLINSALGNFGETVTFAPEPEGSAAHVQSLIELAGEMRGGRVDTLVIIGGNPAYDGPVDVDFAGLLSSMREAGGAVVHLSEYFDETSEICDWHVNRAHYLEAWGDARAHDGTVSITQPLIEPLFGGVSAIEMLSLVIDDEPAEGYDIVRRTFGEVAGDVDFERVWRRTLHDGVMANSAPGAAQPNILWGEAHMHAIALHRDVWRPAQEGEIELIFVRDQKVHDGRFANNGWLQELPETMSKLTWDNALLVNPEVANEMGLRAGFRRDRAGRHDVVAIQVGDREIEAAVIPLPGIHRGSAAIALGYGRRMGEARVATGAGSDSYRLRASQAMGFVPARLRKVGRLYSLAITQDHHPIDSPAQRVFGGIQDRLPSLYRETTVDDFRERGGTFAKKPPGLHVPHRLSQWEENFPFHSAAGFPGARYAWAMSIDLSTCTGCSACVVACQAENNIPVVGKDQVVRQREMHWIRVDRYFRGGTERRPEAVGFMPVPCMHCENAPCEQVCPVAATVHDKDGLNVMVYNRCIGTRYCSNNCPYKVRRFNYFDYYRRRPLRETGAIHVEADYYGRAQAAPEPLHQMQMNPEVTLRSRGVMEKCTFCVQRITQAKIQAKNEWVKKSEEEKRADPRVAIPDGTIVPACAQACPAEAIIFGDLLDPDSRVSQLHASERSYEMLEELNTKPRTRYLGKLRNPGGRT